MALHGFPLTHFNDMDLTGGIPVPNPPKSIFETEPLHGITLATAILPGNIFSGEHDGHEFYGSRASIVWKA